MLAELGGASAYVGGTTGGAANVQTLSYLSPQGYALQPGAPIVCVAGFSNSAAATLNVLGTGAKSIFRNTVGGPVALVGGEIVAGSVCLFVYDGTRYELLNPASVTTGPLSATDGHLAVFDGTSGQILKDGGAPASASKIAQVVTYETGASATGTTTLPTDNTKPQSNEGDQFMLLAITPTNAGSTLIVMVVLYGVHSGVAGFSIALFRDAGVDAIAAVSSLIASNGMTLTLNHPEPAGSTSATTFKVRAGGNVSGTTTFNGIGGSQVFGGVASSSIIIIEVLP